MGCSTTKAYDKTTPPEQICTVKITNSIYAELFDGQDVSKVWKTPNLGELTLKIPEGRHDFMFSVFYSGKSLAGGRDVQIRANGLNVSRNFVAGHSYVVVTEPPMIELMNSRSGSISVRTVIVDTTKTATTGGLFTITNASEINGKYIVLYAVVGSMASVTGMNSQKGRTFIGVKVENGRAEIPVWYRNLATGKADFFDYEGTDISEEAQLFIT
jgi:hypothetical protein